MRHQATFGACLGPLYPGVMALLTEQNFAMTGVITAVLIFGGSVGEMVVPFLIGYLFDTSPLWLPRICAGSIVTMVLVLLLAVALMRRQHVKHNAIKDAVV